MDSIAVIGKALGEQYVAAKRKRDSLDDIREWLEAHRASGAIYEVFRAMFAALRETGDAAAWELSESFYAVVQTDRAVNA